MLLWHIFIAQTKHTHIHIPFINTSISLIFYSFKLPHTYAHFHFSFNSFLSLLHHTHHMQKKTFTPSITSFLIFAYLFPFFSFQFSTSHTHFIFLLHSFIYLSSTFSLAISPFWCFSYTHDSCSYYEISSSQGKVVPCLHLFFCFP
jgi:hypothetical protein